MTGKVVGWAMEQVCGSPITKLVLIKLADNANDLGFCYPSIDLIVEHTELSERSVRKHIYELERLGHIRVDRRNEDGVHFKNRYFLNVPAAAQRETKTPKGIAGRAIPKHAEQNQQLETSQPLAVAVSEPQDTSAGEIAPIASGAIPRHPMPDDTAPDASPSCTPCITLLQEVPPHIDEPPKEPSSEPPPLTREGEGGQFVEPNRVVEIAKLPDFLVRDPVELFMRAGPWHPSSIHHDTRKAMAECANLPPIDDLVAAAKRYFAAMEVKNAKRRKDDPMHMRSAAAFIRKAMWKDYPPPPPKPIVGTSTDRKHVWGMHPAAESLRKQVGDAEFDQWFAVCKLKVVNYMPILIAPSQLVRDRLATKHGARLDAEFGDGFRLELLEQVAA